MTWRYELKFVEYSGGLSTTTRFLGKAALRKAAVTSSEAMAKSGKDAPHESKNRSIAASRSEVEILPKISEVILPQATNSDLVFVRFDGEDALRGKFSVLLTL